jgi:hypothetical protein
MLGDAPQIRELAQRLPMPEAWLAYSEPRHMTTSSSVRAQLPELEAAFIRIASGAHPLA